MTRAKAKPTAALYPEGTPLDENGVPANGGLVSEETMKQIGAVDLDSARVLRQNQDTLARKTAGETDVPWNGDDRIRFQQIITLYPDCWFEFRQIEPVEDDNIESQKCGVLKTYDDIVRYLREVHWRGDKATYKWVAKTYGYPQRGTGNVKFREDPMFKRQWEQQNQSWGPQPSPQWGQQPPWMQLQPQQLQQPPQQVVPMPYPVYQPAAPPQPQYAAAPLGQPPTPAPSPPQPQSAEEYRMLVQTLQQQASELGQLREELRRQQFQQQPPPGYPPPGYPPPPPPYQPQYPPPYQVDQYGRPYPNPYYPVQPAPAPIGLAAAPPAAPVAPPAAPAAPAPLTFMEQLAQTQQMMKGVAGIATAAKDLLPDREPPDVQANPMDGKVTDLGAMKIADMGFMRVVTDKDGKLADGLTLAMLNSDKGEGILNKLVGSVEKLMDRRVSSREKELVMMREAIQLEAQHAAIQRGERIELPAKQAVVETSVASATQTASDFASRVMRGQG